MSDLTMIPPLAGLLSLIIAVFIYFYIKSQPRGSFLMQDLERMIHEGTMAFLKREYLVLALFTICVVPVLLFFFKEMLTPGAFLSGLLSSIIVIHVGAKAAARGNSRTAEAANKSGRPGALAISYLSGSVTGLFIGGLGLLGLGGWLWKLGGDPDIVRYLSWYAMGASFVALFVRIGGGIFAKAADLGSGLAERIEPGIFQDDPRNPGAIADNVGENVGDIAGMGADLFESYVASIIACLAIGASIAIAPESADQSLFLKDSGASDAGALYMGLPLLVAVAGQISSFIGIISIKAFRGRLSAAALRTTIFIADIIFIAILALVTGLMGMSWGLLWAMISGVICGIVLGLLAEYFTSGPPVSRISEQARSGPASVIISGLITGMSSTCLPVLAICAAVFSGYYTAGVYGLGIMAVGLIATAGIAATVDAYASIADNACGISGMSGLGASTRKIIGSLDTIGNTTADMGKGFASGSAAITAIALFAAYAKISGLQTISITNPLVIAGVLIGGMIPMFTAARTMASVGDAAFRIVEEIRRQFREIPGLLGGKEGVKPDSRRIASIATGAAIKGIVAPGLTAVICPVAVGVLLGSEVLGGMILGTAVMGIFLSLFMLNSGGAWNNAKRYIESGNFGGKGSDNHRASVVGDMVGDPFKDTSGPAMNTLIKVVAIVSLLVAPFIKPMGILFQ